MPEPIGIGGFLPTFITLPDGTEVGVTWIKLGTFERKPDKSEIQKRTIEALMRGDPIPKISEEAEVRDIWAPVLPPEYVTIENQQSIFNKLYSIGEDGIPEQMTKIDMTQTDLDYQDFTKIESYYSLVNASIQRGIFNDIDILSNFGVKKALTTYALSMAGGGFFDQDWYKKMTQIQQIVPNVNTYQSLGAGDLINIPEWTRGMTTQPLPMALRRIDEQLVMDIMSKTPAALEIAKRQADLDRLQLFEQYGRTDVALNYLQQMPEDIKRDAYARILGKTFTGIGREGIGAGERPTRYGIGQFLQKPENLPLFETALARARMQAKRLASQLYPTADPKWAELQILADTLNKELSSQLGREGFPEFEPVSEAPLIPSGISAIEPIEGETEEDIRRKQWEELVKAARLKGQVGIQRPQKLTRI